MQALPSRGMEPPADLLQEIRAILPTAMLYNIVDNHWWLLNYAPTPGRREAGQKIIDREYNRLKDGRSARASVLLVGEIGRAGYELWGRYQWTGEPPRQYILNQVRQKVAASMRALDAEMEQRLSDNDTDDVRGTKLKDFLEAEGRSLHRWTAYDRKHFVMGGQHVQR